MKKMPFLTWSVLLFLSAPLIHAEATDPTKLRLPWEALKKILGMDRAEITLTSDEFQSLSRNVSPKNLPLFTQVNGQVRLSREEFKRLIETLVPPLAQAPHVYITKASYHGRLRKEALRVEASLRIHVLKKSSKPLRIDLFPSGFVLREALLEDQPALAEEEGGRLYLTTTRTGDFTVKLSFSVKIPEAASHQRVGFAVPPTPITEVQFDLPDRNLEAHVDGALSMETRSSADGLIVTALLPPVNWIGVAWNPMVPETAKGPAKIYVDAGHLLSVEDDALRVRSTLRLNVIQNTVKSLSMDVPTGFSVIDVSGDALGEWKETTPAGRKGSLLHIPLAYARKGFFQINVTWEKILTNIKSTTTFTGLPVRGATREKGFLGVELRTSAEVPEPVQEGLERVDIQELPPDMLALSNRPLLYGYRYLRPPYHLALAVTRHEDVSVLSSVVDRAEGQTVLEEDGKRVHQITYYVRNSDKQFLEVILPPQARLWSAFVEGAPVKPSKGENGKVLIPLARSRNNGTASFPVEITYYEEGSVLRLLGRMGIQFPVPDMIVSRISWTVYGPPDRSFVYLGRDLERVKTSPQIDGVQLSGPSSADARNEFIQSVDEITFDHKKKANLIVSGPLKSPALKPQLMRIPESAFRSDTPSAPSEVAGVLPIRVRVTPMGQSYQFAKSLPEKNSFLSLPLYYISRGLMNFLRWILAVLLLCVLYRRRSNITQRVRQILDSVRTVRIPGFKGDDTP